MNKIINNVGTSIKKTAIFAWKYPRKKLWCGVVYGVLRKYQRKYWYRFVDFQWTGVGMFPVLMNVDGSIVHNTARKIEIVE